MKAQQMPVSMILHLLETEILSIPSNRLLRARSQDLSLTKLENARQVLLNVLSIYLVIQPILYKFIYLSSKLHCYKQFYFKMLQYLKDKSQVTFVFFLQMWLVIFPEGTRYNVNNTAVIEKSKAFASEKGKMLLHLAIALETYQRGLCNRHL